MRIFKYELNPVGETVIETQRPRVLHLALQRGKPHAWVEIDERAHPTKMRIVAVPTGADVPPRGAYLGTLLFNGGEFVIHYYDAGTASE